MMKPDFPLSVCVCVFMGSEDRNKPDRWKHSDTNADDHDDFPMPRSSTHSQEGWIQVYINDLHLKMSTYLEY